MKSIYCEFRRICEIAVDELLHTQLGVYVIWAGKAQRRPTYIGEGNIWDRLAQHRDRFPRPIDGYVAILDQEKSVSSKYDCQIVEDLLIWIAKDTDRAAPNNKRDGNAVRLDQQFDKHGVVKVFFKGRDPFLDPAENRDDFDEPRIVRIHESKLGELVIDHPWRKLRALS